MAIRKMEFVVCNVCLTRDDHEAVASFDEVITVGEVRKRLALCEKHEAEFMAMLVFLDRFGEETDATSTTPLIDALSRQAEVVPVPKLKLPFGCKFCDGTFKTGQQRAKHVRDDHQGRVELKQAEKIEIPSVLGGVINGR